MAERPYLSLEELSQRTPWSPEAIRRMLQRGTLRKGVHYFQPAGHRGRIVFKWDAIVKFIEGEQRRESIVRSKHSEIDVGEVESKLQRLLG